MFSLPTFFGDQAVFRRSDPPLLHLVPLCEGFELQLLEIETLPFRKPWLEFPHHDPQQTFSLDAQGQHLQRLKHS